MTRLVRLPRTPRVAALPAPPARRRTACRWTSCRRVLLGCLAAALLLPAPLPAQTFRVQTFPNPQPALELDNGSQWLNTAGPLTLRDLRGKFVILDFWTYCCINCLHMLPELKRLEQAYPNELVVIGVHSAKFPAERELENVREAVLRYGVEHPVVNDPDRVLWRRYGVSVWPTLVFIDPLGRVIASHQGEIPFEALDEFLRRQLLIYQRLNALDPTPVRFELEQYRAVATPLRYPGKILADESTGRLFIADTGHHRLVVTSLDGQLLDVIGSGRPGHRDGSFGESQFDSPHGLALDGQQLYVADTNNHRIRRVDLASRRVETVAGSGRQLRQAVRRASPRPLATDLASPWDLWIHDGQLYIAMAGVHQIWSLALASGRIGPYAGNAIEDIVDGPLLPRVPYQAGFSAFAQPSGLASDGSWLFVADSEGSSIRAVPLGRGDVTTLVGTAHLPAARLFTFGDRDGPLQAALLQHPKAVAYHDRRLYVADTYNDKVKVIDIDRRTIHTLLPDASAGGAAASLSEPGGLTLVGGRLFVADTNNHRIVHAARDNPGPLVTLDIAGLQPPPPPDETPPDPWAGVAWQEFGPVERAPSDGRLRLTLRLNLPPQHRVSSHSPMHVLVRDAGAGSLLPAELQGVPQGVEHPAEVVELDLPLAAPEGRLALQVALNFYYCREGAEGICRAASAGWSGTVELGPGHPGGPIELQHRVGR